jgi:hypothetical protein
MKRIALAAALGLAATLTACSGTGSGSSALPSASNQSAVHRDAAAGVSSGADMATQLHFSYSANVKGEAIFAGSPFFCALGTSDAHWGLVYGPTYSDDYALYSCSGTEYWSEGESPPLSTLETDTNNAASDGYLDPVSDLSGSKAWIFSGEDDTVVAQEVVKDSATMLSHYGVSTTTNYTTAAEHGWVTPDVTSACGTLNSNYLINCGFELLRRPQFAVFDQLQLRRRGSVPHRLLRYAERA